MNGKCKNGRLPENDIILDIMDKEGEIHAHGMNTLLPKGNEVQVHTSTSTSTSTMYNSSKMKLNIDAMFDDEKLHYILRGGTEFEQGTMTELFTYYGNSYKHVRK